MAVSALNAEHRLRREWGILSVIIFLTPEASDHALAPLKPEYTLAAKQLIADRKEILVPLLQAITESKDSLGYKDTVSKLIFSGAIGRRWIIRSWSSDWGASGLILWSI